MKPRTLGWILLTVAVLLWLCLNWYARAADFSGTTFCAPRVIAEYKASGLTKQDWLEVIDVMQSMGAYTDTDAAQARVHVAGVYDDPGYVQRMCK